MATPLRLRFDTYELDEGNARQSREGAAILLPLKVFPLVSFSESEVADYVADPFPDIELNEPIGFALLREGYERHTRLGMYAGCTEGLCAAAEAVLLAGDLAGAQQQLDESLALAQRINERVYLVPLHRMQARVHLARKKENATHEAMEAALAEARAQQAPWLEQRAGSA